MDEQDRKKMFMLLDKEGKTLLSKMQSIVDEPVSLIVIGVDKEGSMISTPLPRDIVLKLLETSMRRIKEKEEIDYSGDKNNG